MFKKINPPPLHICRSLETTHSQAPLRVPRLGQRSERQSLGNHVHLFDNWRIKTILWFLLVLCGCQRVQIHELFLNVLIIEFLALRHYFSSNVKISSNWQISGERHERAMVRKYRVFDFTLTLLSVLNLSYAYKGVYCLLNYVLYENTVHGVYAVQSDIWRRQDHKTTLSVWWHGLHKFTLLVKIKRLRRLQGWHPFRRNLVEMYCHFTIIFCISNVSWIHTHQYHYQDTHFTIKKNIHFSYSWRINTHSL